MWYDMRFDLRYCFFQVLDHSRASKYTYNNSSRFSNLPFLLGLQRALITLQLVTDLAGRGQVEDDSEDDGF